MTSLICCLGSTRIEIWQEAAHIRRAGRDSDCTEAVVQGKHRAVLIISLLTMFKDEHRPGGLAFQFKTVRLEP